jgi:hypothetical protein
VPERVLVVVFDLPCHGTFKAIVLDAALASLLDEAVRSMMLEFHIEAALLTKVFRDLLLPNRVFPRRFLSPLWPSLLW